MNRKLILNTRQKIAVRKARLAADKFYTQMLALSKAWDELEKSNAPVGFMDFQYPFNTKFDELITNVELWKQDVKEKATRILNECLLLILKMITNEHTNISSKQSSTSNLYSYYKSKWRANY